MTWLSDHLGLVLVAGLGVGIAALVLGGVAAWRTGSRLRTPQRSIVRFALSLLLTLVGAGASLLFGSGVVQIGPQIRAQRSMVGEAAPELPFALVESDLAGRLSDYRGRVVLVNVWATWCPPCREEMPALDRLQTAHGDRGLVVLHLSDESRDTLRLWLEEHPASTVHAYAEPLPWPDSGRPTSYVVDREGVVRRVLLGARSFDQFEAEIEPHL